MEESQRPRVLISGLGVMHYNARISKRYRLIGAMYEAAMMNQPLFEGEVR